MHDVDDLAEQEFDSTKIAARKIANLLQGLGVGDTMQLLIDSFGVFYLGSIHAMNLNEEDSAEVISEIILRAKVLTKEIFMQTGNK